MITFLYQSHDITKPVTQEKTFWDGTRYYDNYRNTTNTTLLAGRRQNDELEVGGNYRPGDALIHSQSVANRYNSIVWKLTNEPVAI